MIPFRRNKKQNTTKAKRKVVPNGAEAAKAKRAADAKRAAKAKRASDAKRAAESKRGMSAATGNRRLPPAQKAKNVKESQQFCCAPCYDILRGGVKVKSCLSSKEKYVPSNFTPPQGKILPRREGKNGIFFYIDKSGNEKQCSFDSKPVGCVRKKVVSTTLKKTIDKPSSSDDSKSTLERLKNITVLDAGKKTIDQLKKCLRKPKKGFNL